MNTNSSIQQQIDLLKKKQLDLIMRIRKAINDNKISKIKKELGLLK